MSPSWHILPWALSALGAGAFAWSTGRMRRAQQGRDQAHRELATVNATLVRITQAVASATDAIGIGDFSGHSVYQNQAHLDLFGYTVEELNAVAGEGVLFADSATAQKILASIRSGRSWSGETEIRTKNGRPVPAFVRADIIRDEAGAPVGIFGIFRDISRERQLALDAARASQLDSLGLMAGGIAHDFANLVGVMLCYVEMAQLEPILPPTVRTRLEDLEQVILRARDFTLRLKAFAKGETPQMRSIALDLILREAAVLAVQASPVRLDCNLPRPLWPTVGDESQLLQVFNNLAINAVQAMPAGGTLTIRAANLTVAEGEQMQLPDGEWLQVTVADTGTGMPPEVQARIFEPFFTTKKSGTGLGLPTAYSIVAKHGGHLRVASREGRGTTFTVLLPASRLGVPALAPNYGTPAKFVSKSA